MRVLLVEDEVTIAVTLRDALLDAGHIVLTADDTASGLALLASEECEVVITDVRLPGAGGLAVLDAAVRADPERPVLVMTGYATVDDAVDAMRRGAVDYIQKPFRNEAVVRRVEAFGGSRRLARENEALRRELSEIKGFEGIIGRSTAMQQVFERVRTVAVSDATVLIQGESGTGKERIARALHELSRRSAGPFVAISCAALPETLLEAELFGHEKGAFTDAKERRRGRFELAGGGTLFLDDIDDMPLATQVKLLRALQEREFERIGGEQLVKVDIRVVVATKVDLQQRVKEGRFRDDLYWRIHVVPIHLPPLRQRDGDVPLLVQHLLERHAGGRSYTIARQTMALLERYPWPGNVRELENAVQRALALAGPEHELAAEDLLPVDRRWRGAAAVPKEIRPLREVVKAKEREHLALALEWTGGHRSQAADLLGISRKVLWEKLKEHQLEDGPEDEPPGEGKGA